MNPKHFIQKTEGFANVLREFLFNVPIHKNDKVLFGMPNTVFRGNPFREMLEYNGIACGIFTTNDESKFDGYLSAKNSCKTAQNFNIAK